MKIPYKAVQLEDADIFSLDGIHKKYWKDFHDTCHTRIGFSPMIEGDDSYENRYTAFKVFRMFQAEYCETDETDLCLTTANDGKQPGCVVDVDNENKNVVVQNITVHGDVVLKKETNIGTNYGPNIENNGGTLKLPEEK